MSGRPAAILRPGARVIVLDGRDRILLFRVRTPGQDPPESWITPGGALERGESHEDCARRELREETGLADVELGPCVWRRRETWRWEERLYDSPERFFLVRVERLEVVAQALGDIESVTLMGHRWWSVPELAASSAVFIPRDLATLLPPLIAGDLPPEPLEVGE
jgi:8-oxo-dGTP pyrophosphatase MutT (NUDIX family)